MTRDLVAIVTEGDDDSRDLTRVVGVAPDPVLVAVDSETPTFFVDSGGLQGGVGQPGPRGLQGPSGINAIIGGTVSPLPPMSVEDFQVPYPPGDYFHGQMFLWVHTAEDPPHPYYYINNLSGSWILVDPVGSEGPEGPPGPPFVPTVSTVPPGPSDDAAGSLGDLWLVVT